MRVVSRRIAGARVVSAVRGLTRQATALHEAAHATVALALGFPVLLAAASRRDGVMLLGSFIGTTDDLGTIVMAGSAHQTWIGEADAEHCEEYIRQAAIEAGYKRLPGARVRDLLTCRWRSRACEILARNGLLHARLAMGLVARGVLLLPDITRIATGLAPRSRRIDPSLFVLWRRGARNRDRFDRGIRLVRDAMTSGGGKGSI